jgi:hypothetical protein
MRLPPLPLAPPRLVVRTTLSPRPLLRPTMSSRSSSSATQMTLVRARQTSISLLLQGALKQATRKRKTTWNGRAEGCRCSLRLQLEDSRSSKRDRHTHTPHTDLKRIVHPSPTSTPPRPHVMLLLAACGYVGSRLSAAAAPAPREGRGLTAVCTLAAHSHIAYRVALHGLVRGRKAALGRCASDAARGARGRARRRLAGAARPHACACAQRWRCTSQLHICTLWAAIRQLELARAAC